MTISNVDILNIGTYRVNKNSAIIIKLVKNVLSTRGGFKAHRTPV